jgi:peptidoglycan/xylan/chitin deacetylase (PgdA/CDA1 family)
MTRLGALTGSVAVLCVVVVVVAASAGASSIGAQPFGVTSATLTQNGRQLVWQVALDHRFSPAALAKSGRTLCLLIERASDGSVTGSLCAAGSRHGRHAGLVFQAAAGTAVPISASISRSGGDELTASFAPGQIGNAFRSIRWQVVSGLRPPACRPPAPNPLGCTTAFPSQPALAKLHTPRLVGCVPSGPPFVTSGSPDRPEVALTFDDGPWPDTPQFLHILEKDHVPATFFQIGEHVPVYGGAVDRRMLADGDMIGDHTWSHIDVAGAGPVAAQQISETAAAIRRLTGFTPCLFRAPGGVVGPALIAEARAMGFTTIQWNVDPRDWASPGVSAIYTNVIGHVQDGSIIIQHDGGGDRSETIAALPKEIATLRGRGYKFVTVTQLLGQRLIYK